MKSRLLVFPLLCTAILLTQKQQAVAADVVTIVIAKNAPQIEQLAARELAKQFQKLFDADVSTLNEISATGKNLVLIGSPTTNPAVKKVLGNNWPKIIRQGIVLKSFQSGSQSGIIVGGESPVATLWAAYELGHRFGIRYMLREDIYPAEKIPLKLDGFDIVMRPTLNTRTWRTIDEFAYGAESWGIAGHRRLLKQFAKMKFNSVMLSVSPWQPFVHYEFDGVKKQTGVLWHGEEYRVDGDTPYKPVFNGAKVFTNPDFTNAKTYEQRTAAGIKLANGIIAEAHRLGMTVGISFSPLEFPKEFAVVAPSLQPTGVLNDLLIAPSEKTRISDKQLGELVTAKIKAYLAAYPAVDRLYLKMPEAPTWSAHAETAWKQLGGQNNLDGQTLSGILDSARKQKLIGSDKKGAARVSSNVVALSFLNTLFNDKSLLKRPDGKSVDLVITQVHPALASVCDRLLPQGAGVLFFVDKTSRRVAAKKSVLKNVPTKKVRAQLYLTLADKGLGIVPQADTEAIAQLVETIRKQGWDGFCTRSWNLGELDPTVHYLSRAAFDSEVTPRSAHDDLFVTITGKQAPADRLWKCFGHIAKATALIDKHDPQFAFSSKNMIVKHFVAEPIPEWWAEVNTEYIASMIELYRSHSASRSQSLDYLYYCAKRGEFVVNYLACVQATREAALAQKKGDLDTAIEKIETAIESIYNAINVLGEVPHDQSDLGLMAVMTTNVYRPLMAEYEKLADAAESE